MGRTAKPTKRFLTLLAELNTATGLIDANPEIITAREALTRVGLAGLALSHGEDRRIVWSGYPTPMATGLYKEGRRISRHSCGGYVLFSWDTPQGDVIGQLVVSINPETTKNRYGNYAPAGSALCAGWSGF